MSKLSDIFAQLEREHTVQYLQEVMVKAVDKKRGNHTEVTFATRDNNTNGLYTGSGKTAVIVWVDREDFNSAIIKAR